MGLEAPGFGRSPRSVFTVTVNACYTCRWNLSFNVQRTSSDQAHMSSKFETLGGELDEKRKCCVVSVDLEVCS